MKLSKTHQGRFMGNSFSGAGQAMMVTQSGGGPAMQERLKQLELKRLARKEGGWNNNIKPISKYNSQVHPSMRIPFEQI